MTIHKGPLNANRAPLPPAEAQILKYGLPSVPAAVSYIRRAGSDGATFLEEIEQKGDGTHEVEVDDGSPCVFAQ